MQPTRKPHLFCRMGRWWLRAGAWTVNGTSPADCWGHYIYNTQWKRLYA